MNKTARKLKEIREKRKRDRDYENINSSSLASLQHRTLVPVDRKGIIGFWHICMTNNYFEIISEQLELLVKSELYENSSYIYVGCLGSKEDFDKVSELFSKHSKIRLEFNGDQSQFEFPTLLHFKKVSDSEPEFFGFYFHTKGVSYPGNEGGKHWRDYMNYYCITKWKDNLGKLMEGYNTCGVKLLNNNSFPMHYSGNFWWVNSSYAKTLRPIEVLNKKDRFQAEMWVCSNNPIAATLCQKFVDYNTKGEFVPDKNRIIVHTLAYNLTTEVRDATKLLYEQNDKNEFEHLIVDLGFPITNGNEIPKDIEAAKLINARENLSTAILYGSRFMSIKNEGVSQNWNVVKKQMNPSDNDVLICADPDERPQNNGWVKAVADVIIYGDKIAWCSLIMKEHIPHLMSSEKRVIQGHNVYILKSSLNWAQGGFSCKFLNEIGGVPVPTGAPIYGWIEDACLQKMKRNGYMVAVLADYFVEHTECSKLYRAWKTDITSNVKNGQIDFGQWLKKQKITS